jgi:hypothetical protein
METPYRFGGKCGRLNTKPEFGMSRAISNFHKGVRLALQLEREVRRDRKALSPVCCESSCMS